MVLGRRTTNDVIRNSYVCDNRNECDSNYLLHQTNYGHAVLIILNYHQYHNYKECELVRAVFPSKFKAL